MKSVVSLLCWDNLGQIYHEHNYSNKWMYNLFLVQMCETDYLKPFALFLHCLSNGVFQEDLFQVVISGWWVSTNKTVF